MDDSEVLLPKVDVLLASYNGVRYIRQQIESLISQENVDVQIFVFDDGSTDGTVAILSEYARVGQITFCVRKESTGGAFNNYKKMVLEFSPTNSLIAFCDQDDIWLPHKLATQIAAMHRAGAVGCSSSVEAFYDDSEIRPQYINNSGSQRRFDYLFEGGGQGCTYLFGQEVYLALRSVLSKDSEVVVPHDWLMYAICRARGWPWLILDEPLVRYRQHQENAFGARSNWSGKIARVQMLVSGSFRTRRLEIFQLLQRDLSVQEFPTALVKSNPGFFIRFGFVTGNFLDLRRFRLHSWVMAIFFLFKLS